MSAAETIRAPTTNLFSFTVQASSSTPKDALRPTDPNAPRHIMGGDPKRIQTLALQVR